MHDKIKTLFQDLGFRFEDKNFAEIWYENEVWYENGCPSQPGIYKATNVHAFYRGYLNPTIAIYVRGYPELSTESEAHISAKLIEDTDRWAVSSEISKSWKENMDGPLLSPLLPEKIEEIITRVIDRVESSHKMEGVKFPYDVQIVEEAILKNMPREMLE